MNDKCSLVEYTRNDYNSPLKCFASNLHIFKITDKYGNMLNKNS